MSFHDLTYAAPSDPLIKRLVIQSIERAAGRRRFQALYDIWRMEAESDPARCWRRALELLEVKLDIKGAAWPPATKAPSPLIMIANHPFGLGDGLTLLALMEQLERPFFVMINRELLKVPELHAFAVPIDPGRNRAAQVRNVRARKEALARLEAGANLLVFPAGGIATADAVFGPACELPWKTGTASLIERAGASVAPVFVEGQNGPLFQLASKFSLTLRLALLIPEFTRNFAHSTIKLHIGDILSFNDLKSTGNRKELTRELFNELSRIAPADSSLSHKKCHAPRKLPKWA